MIRTSASSAVALQRCDTFVGRTMNWLYDHLRFVSRYRPYVWTDRLANREEFSEVAARVVPGEVLSRRIWRRLAAGRLYPADRWELRRLRPRVLHSHFGYVAVNDHGLAVALGRPWVVGFYGADVYMLGREAEWRERYARLFDRIARALALGPAMAESLEALGCPREKIEVHALGIDAGGIPRAPRVLEPGATLRVLFAGTFREKKGAQYLVRAVAEARRAGVPIELHLVGDSAGRPGDVETKEEIFRLVRELGLESSTVHHSWLRFDQLLSLALECHVFAAPSVTAADGDAEGTPFIIQQMMATGMPIISTRHSDIPYVFGERADLLLPERDAGAIARRLEELAADPERVTREGEWMADRIRTAFDVRACAERLCAIYDRLG